MMHRLIILTILFVSQTYCNNAKFNDERAAVCGIDNYDITDLTRPASWTFTSNSICLDTMKNSTGCTYTFTFCQSLGTLCNNASAAVCQININGGGTRHRQYSLGRYNQSLDAFTPSISSASGFTAQFAHGEVLDKANRPLGVAIFFNCDENVPWTAHTGQQNAPVPVKAKPTVNFNEEHYTYWINVFYAGACLKVEPIAPTIQPVNDVYLSAGTILIIIFVCCMALYCSVGCIAKACMGIKGPEIIPNNEFWSTLPDYIKEGVMACWSCIRCQKAPSTDFETSSTHKGYDSI